MKREDFERIMREEGLEDAAIVEGLWHSRPRQQLDETIVRIVAQIALERKDTDVHIDGSGKEA